MTKLEKTATVSFVASFLLLAGVLTRGYILSHRPDPRAVPLVKTGELVRLPGFTPGSAESTLVLVLSSQCHYCLDDLPFYKQLSTFRKSSGDSIHLIAVLPERTTSAREFLSNAGIGADDVLSMTPRRLGVQLLPTLLLLDRDGKLQQFWVGELNRNQREEILSVLRKSCAACMASGLGSNHNPTNGALLN